MDASRPENLPKLQALRSILSHTLALLNARERRRFAFLAVANAIISLMDVASLAFLLLVINYYTQSSTGMSDHFSWMPVQPGSLWPAISFLLFFLFRHAAGFLVYNVQSRYVYGVASRMSRNQLLHYLNGAYADYVSVESAKQHHLISHQPIEFAHYVLSGIQQIFTESILILLAVVAIIAFNAKLFFILVVFLLPAVLLAAYFMRKRLKSARANVQADAGKAMQHLQEALQGFIESHVYGRKQFFTDRYYRHQRRLNEHLAEVQIAQWIPGRLVELFAVAGLFLLILINRHYGTVIDTISIGAFIAAAYKIIPGIGRIANLSAQVRTYQYTVSALSRIDHTSVHEDTQTLPPITSVAFRDVAFAHGDKPVLRQHSLRLESGDFACLSAVSGRGKTTLLNLLLGFLKPAEGDIFINNEPADTEGRQRWQGRIAYVKQQTFLIHDTIRRNITLSEEDADPARLQYAVTHTGLAPFIDSFAEGLDKVITDSGRNVSGGQRQRIALARALYKQADVLILDEPFNELDKAAEADMLQHLQQLAGEGRIIILVSHGGNSVAYCNKTLRIDE